MIINENGHGNKPVQAPEPKTEAPKTEAPKPKKVSKE